MTIRVALAGMLRKDQQDYAVHQNANWPDGVPLTHGDSVRFLYNALGMTLEGEISRVTVDLGDQVNQRLGGPPTIHLANLHEV